jgi:hypothetical protein
MIGVGRLASNAARHKPKLAPPPVAGETRGFNAPTRSDGSLSSFMHFRPAPVSGPYSITSSARPSSVSGKATPARDIAAGTTETCDKAESDGIGAHREDNRSGRGSRFGGQRRGDATRRYNQRRRSANEIGDQRRQAAVVAFGPTVFDRDLLAVDVAGLAQALLKRGHVPHECFG